jgi:hypothetical protein
MLAKDEIDEIDLAEKVCTILARKNKNTIKDAAKETKTTIEKVKELIIKYDLRVKAAYLAYDKELFAIDEAKKKLKIRKLKAEEDLKVNLEKLENKDILCTV